MKTTLTLLLTALLLAPLAAHATPPLHAEETQPQQAGGEFEKFHNVPDETVPSGLTSGPHRNSVSIRTLKFRDVPEGGPRDVFKAVHDFHATRLDWVYLDDEGAAEKVSRIKGMGIAVGGAASGETSSTIPPADAGDVGAWQASMATVDLEGKPIVFSWKTWAVKAGITEADTTNPKYFDAHFEYLKRLIDLGCTAIQRDEAGSDGLAASRYGGGFTESALAGFNAWLAKNVSREDLSKLGIPDVGAFNFKEYLLSRNAPSGVAFNDYSDPIKDYWLKYWDDHILDFWTRMMARVKAYGESKGVQVELSCNNSSLQLWNSEQQLFDFAMSELMAGTAWPGHLHNRARVARSFGRHQMFNCPKVYPESKTSEEERVALTRKVIATSYSLGMSCQVPWDKWNAGPDRYFGLPEEYSDLYAFVRANNWAGYEEVGSIGPEIETKSPKLEGLLSIEGGNGYVYAFLNLDRSDMQRPPLLFLVDWGRPLAERPPVEKMSFLEEGMNGKRLYFSKVGLENLKRTPPEDFEVVFAPDSFPNADSIGFVLLSPRPFDPQLYKPASQTTDYKAYVRETKLSFTRDPDGSLRVKIPKLDPWGVLKIVETKATNK